MVLTPARPLTGRSRWNRTLVSVIARTTPPRSTNSSAPGRNRSSGKSVSRLTTTCPRRPCDRTIRPTTAIASQSTLAPVRRVANLERDRLAFLLARRRGQRPQRRSGSALLADHLADLTGRDEQLDE